jgi:hypothetical protein
MDPRFKDIRLTERCLHWVAQNILTRFYVLKRIHGTSLRRETLWGYDSISQTEAHRMVQTIHPQVFTFAVEEVYEEELGLEPIWCYSLPSLKAEIGSKTPGSKRWSRSRITLWKGGHVDCLNAKPYPQRNNVRPFFSSLVEDGRTDFFRRQRWMTATPVLPLYTSRQVFVFEGNISTRGSTGFRT